MNVSGITYAEQIRKMTAKNSSAEKQVEEMINSEETAEKSDELDISENYRRRTAQKVRSIAEVIEESGNVFESAVLNSQMKQSLRILNDEDFNESDKTSADAEKWLDNEKKLRKTDNSLDIYTKLMAKSSEQKLALNRLAGFWFGNEKTQSGNIV